MEKEKVCLYCREDNPEDALYCLNCGKGFAAAGTRMIGLLKNRYQIMRKIKSGAMGCVYEALDTVTNDKVAIKQLNCSIDNSESEYKRKKFLEEADILSKLCHSGIPSVIDFFISNTSNGSCSVEDYYLVMELIEGPDFESVIKEDVVLPLASEKVIEYAKQILGTLKYLHSQNPPIIFRDLKPSNLMMKNGRLVMVDFGIARVLKNREKGTQIGTPGYAPPEQYKGFAEPASDYYALGVLMHYLLSGTDPEDPSLAPFCFESLSGINREVPVKLSALIDSMLDLAIINRPKSADEIIGELNSIWTPLVNHEKQVVNTENSLSQCNTQSKQKKVIKKTFAHFIFGLIFFLVIAGGFSNLTNKNSNTTQRQDNQNYTGIPAPLPVKIAMQQEKKNEIIVPSKSGKATKNKDKKAKTIKTINKKTPSVKAKPVKSTKNKREIIKSVIVKETPQYSNTDSDFESGYGSYNYKSSNDRYGDNSDYVFCDYTVGGIIVGGDGNQVILQSGISSYTGETGTVLPDGWIIKEITAKSVTLKNGKKEIKLLLRD
jgi:serine/threonine-protein kinase